mmetsp:Transcript_160474/g.389750  ORF Transcript_160474/g.389750 Transcript_160474/m.389750 type:complete len:269 (-) Transcript_160474:92-898(-)
MRVQNQRVRLHRRVVNGLERVHVNTSPANLVDCQPQLSVDGQQVHRRVLRAQVRAEGRAGARAEENAAAVVLLRRALERAHGVRQPVVVEFKAHHGGEPVEVVGHAMREDARQKTEVTRAAQPLGLTGQQSQLGGDGRVDRAQEVADVPARRLAGGAGGRTGWRCGRLLRVVPRSHVLHGGKHALRLQPLLRAGDGRRGGERARQYQRQRQYVEVRDARHRARSQAHPLGGSGAPVAQSRHVSHEAVSGACRAWRACAGPAAGSWSVG